MVPVPLKAQWRSFEIDFAQCNGVKIPAVKCSFFDLVYPERSRRISLNKQRNERKNFFRDWPESMAVPDFDNFIYTNNWRL